MIVYQSDHMFHVANIKKFRIYLYSFDSEIIALC